MVGFDLSNPNPMAAGDTLFAEIEIEYFLNLNLNDILWVGQLHRQGLKITDNVVVDISSCALPLNWVPSKAFKATMANAISGLTIRFALVFWEWRSAKAKVSSSTASIEPMGDTLVLPFLSAVATEQTLCVSSKSFIFFVNFPVFIFHQI
jgi:hypothetical protein